MRPFIAFALCFAAMTGCHQPQPAAMAKIDYRGRADVALGLAAMAPGGDAAPVTPANKAPRAQCKECGGTGKVKSGDGLITYDCTNCYAAGAVSKALPAAFAALALPNADCACGSVCPCAAELAELKAYRDQAEKFFQAHGYRDIGRCVEKTIAGYAPGATTITRSEPATVTYYSSGSCAGGQCTVQRQPARRGLFGWRR